LSTEGLLAFHVNLKKQALPHKEKPNNKLNNKPNNLNKLTVAIPAKDGPAKIIDTQLELRQNNDLSLHPPFAYDLQSTFQGQP